MTGASAPTRSIRVMVVEDHDLMRDATVRFLGRADDLEVVSAVGSIEDAMVVVASADSAVDVVVLDMKLPGMGGAEGIPLLRRVMPGLKVLVLTMLESTDAREAVRGAGADGFLTKGCAPSELVEAVRHVARGGSVGFGPHAAPGAAVAPKAPSAATALTADEVAVLRLLLDSKSVGEIAGELSMAVRSVAVLVGSISQKAGGSSKPVWLRYALDHDLL